MTERRKKILVVAVGLLLFVPVTLWRSLGALNESDEESGEAREYACEGLVRFEPADALPPGLGATNVHRYRTVPDVPALRLGTLRLAGPLDLLNNLDREKPHEYGCLRRAKEAIGANAWVLDRIDAPVPGLPEGWGELVESVYLLHAGELPAEYRDRLGPAACLVSQVKPGTDAARAGLEVGDVMLALDRAPVRRSNPCELLVHIDDLPGGAPVTIQVLRKGAALDLHALAPADGVRFGCEVRRLPIL